MAENRRYWNDDAEQWRPDTHPVMAGTGSLYDEERRRAIREVLDDYTPLRGEWGLDLGGGQGLSAYFGWQQKTKRVLLGDISRNMLTLSYNPHKVVLDATASRLPLASQHFDWVTAFFLMRYLTFAEQDNLVNEIARVLKPGGLALILDHETLEHPMERGIFSPTKLARTTDLGEVTITQVLSGNFDLGEGYDDDARYLGPLFLFALHKPK